MESFFYKCKREEEGERDEGILYLESLAFTLHPALDEFKGNRDAFLCHFLPEDQALEQSHSNFTAKKGVNLEASSSL